MLYDVAVIDAGVVGSLIARELTRCGVSVCLIDRFPEPGSGTSRANAPSPGEGIHGCRHSVEYASADMD